MSEYVGGVPDFKNAYNGWKFEVLDAVELHGFVWNPQTSLLFCGKSEFVQYKHCFYEGSTCD